jgi:quercetin dioxygenase-like cupin family protein
MTTPDTIAVFPLPGHGGVHVAALAPMGAPVGVYAVRLERGAGIPRHVHVEQETVVARGPLTVEVAGVTHELRAGDRITIAPGVEHEVGNAAPYAVEYLSIASPDWGQAAPVVVPPDVIAALRSISVGDSAAWCLDTAQAFAEEAEEHEGSGAIDDAMGCAALAAAHILRALALLTADAPERQDGRET